MTLPILSALLESGGLHRCPHTPAEAPPTFCGCAEGECAHPARPEIAHTRRAAEKPGRAPFDRMDLTIRAIRSDLLIIDDARRRGEPAPREAVVNIQESLGHLGQDVQAARRGAARGDR